MPRYTSLTARKCKDDVAALHKTRHYGVAAKCLRKRSRAAPAPARPVRRFRCGLPKYLVLRRRQILGPLLRQSTSASLEEVTARYSVQRCALLPIPSLVVTISTFATARRKCRSIYKMEHWRSHPPKTVSGRLAAQPPQPRAKMP